MTQRDLPRAARMIPPSTATVRYPGRTPHWIKPNHTERIPHRWLVADCESHRVPAIDGECQTLRCAVGVRWRDDLPTGDRREVATFTRAIEFWRWVTDWCYTHGRTVLWFHNASVDLAWLEAFTCLPALGYELTWCNLDRDVSVVNWRGPNGTLVIADTYTWTGKGLAELAPLTGIVKPPLPAEDDSEEAWLARCTADVEITEAIVRELLQFVRDQHLGNWQPSGAGMGYTTWRHRHYTHKVLVHDDADALAAEREAMHAGRAEAWWHGRARGGPFTEWDMHMSYCRIAAECDVPAKLWDHDIRPTSRVHRWALKHFRVLAKVRVRCDVPVVPARVDGRTCWPVGEFDTTLWDTELQLVEANGGSYTVTEQWRYTRKPVLASWAAWTIRTCDPNAPGVPLIARTWAKHQSRAVIGRLGLRTATWEEWGDNWMPYSGVSYLTDSEDGQLRRLMHVGSKVFIERDRAETQQSCPQITSWIMAEARRRLWAAAIAAGTANVVHTDTDSLITNARGSVRLAAAAEGGLDGHWRTKDRWRSLDLTGPRHYRTPTSRKVPGVPMNAVETKPGVYVGEVWDSLARNLSEGAAGVVRTRMRKWEPAKVDYRRPWGSEENGPALPIRLTQTEEENDALRMDDRPPADQQVVGVPYLRPRAVLQPERGGGRRGAHQSDRPPDQLGQRRDLRSPADAH